MGKMDVQGAPQVGDDSLQREVDTGLLELDRPWQDDQADDNG
jgi:hypothetical protein